MNKKTSIQIKAAFLALVFVLNTIVGFACAIGTDMGFNASHHRHEATAAAHVHAGGKKHTHSEASAKHGQVKEHHHAKAGNDLPNEKEGCCKDKVIKFQQSDKSLAKSFSYAKPVFITAFMASSYYTDALYTSNVASKARYFFRSFHPPIPDIRIAIQSFQI
jgi:hypothetical protein